MDEKKKWPDVVTAETLAANAGIPDKDIRNDIAATQMEIDSMTQLLGMAGPFLAADGEYVERLDYHWRRVQERKEFVVFLKKLLAARAALN